VAKGLSSNIQRGKDEDPVLGFQCNVGGLVAVDEDTAQA
jgi:hypothetical protein